MQKMTNLNQDKNKEIFALCTASDNDIYKLKKDVVLYVIRQSLLASGKETFELVNRSLFEKYHCEISDCFEKPEYFRDVLNYVYNGSHAKVIESMKRNLDKFAHEGSIKEFLEKIS